MAYIDYDFDGRVQKPGNAYLQDYWSPGGNESIAIPDHKDRVKTHKKKKKKPNNIPTGATGRELC